MSPFKPNDSTSAPTRTGYAVYRGLWSQSKLIERGRIGLWNTVTNESSGTSIAVREYWLERNRNLARSLTPFDQ